MRRGAFEQRPGAPRGWRDARRLATRRAEVSEPVPSRARRGRRSRSPSAARPRSGERGRPVRCRADRLPALMDHEPARGACAGWGTQRNMARRLFILLEGLPGHRLGGGREGIERIIDHRLAATLGSRAEPRRLRQLLLRAAAAVIETAPRYEDIEVVPRRKRGLSVGDPRYVLRVVRRRHMRPGWPPQDVVHHDVAPPGSDAGRAAGARRFEGPWGHRRSSGRSQDVSRRRSAGGAVVRPVGPGGRRDRPSGRLRPAAGIIGRERAPRAGLRDAARRRLPAGAPRRGRPAEPAPASAPASRSRATRGAPRSGGERRGSSSSIASPAWAATWLAYGPELAQAAVALPRARSRSAPSSPAVRLRSRPCGSSAPPPRRSGRRAWRFLHVGGSGSRCCWWRPRPRLLRRRTTNQCRAGLSSHRYASVPPA